MCKREPFEIISVVDGNGDWKPEFISAALRINGWDYASLGEANGLGKKTLRNAIRGPWPKGEAIIADALGCYPREIWPSRFSAISGSE